VEVDAIDRAHVAETLTKALDPDHWGSEFTALILLRLHFRVPADK
jgi:hypothetical protein